MNSSLSIEVSPPSGQRQLFTVEGEHALIGSAAHCEIRLPLDEAAPEHLRLSYRGDAVFVKALSSEPRSCIDGEAFDERELPPDSLLEIGRTRLKVCALAGRKSERKQGDKKSSPWVYLAAPVLIAYAISELPAAASSDEGAPKEPPVLFAEPEKCPELAASSAQALARELMNLAASKRERRPFRAADGVRAVGLYRAAAACFDNAADAQSATQARSAASVLQKDLEESYRTHRVRLEHALAISDDLVASREVRALLDLTAVAGGDYVTWLHSLARRLKLREETPK